jgi:predicted helicase
LSRQLINEYRAELDRVRQASGSRREGTVSEAFKDLLKRWGKTNDLVFLAQHRMTNAKGDPIIPDGALLHGLRVPFGYWEAKDADDDLDKEMAAKFRKGYPKDNIIFSDDETAILYQDGHEVHRAAMDDTDALLPLLTRFFAHERQEVADFRKAVKQFSLDLPDILTALRERIQEKRASSRDFAKAQDDFLKHARDAINPAVSEDDVQEMLIQHILTEDIFAKVFENPDFHRQNNVAVALIALEDKLFGYGEKQKLLRGLGPYYAGIQSTAALIESHSEKQGFLKGLYENFYKVYNPMAADRLGVVYTPGEIVRFMIRSADWLCETHFGKNLIDKGVEILDPATGTGTFIVELMEHFRGNHEKLRHKYKEELHANEVAILPYYVANLNIEATYAAITGQFAEYPNLCFVDTLDNVAALGKYAGHMDDMFGSVSDENMGRIKRQNDRKISVIIGNPPYNANQQNENDNNKNRAYERIDARIKQTYIKASTAQKTKLYDMYARFFRWASDRLGDEGVVAFITNRSFIDAHGFDGFRRTVAKDFSEGWVVDLGGDYKKKGVGGSGNVFGIGTGVAISFWVKRKDHKGKMKLSYVAVPSGTGEDKLAWLAGRGMDEKGWQQLAHRDDAGWIDIPDAETGGMLPLIDKKTKERDGPSQDRSIFKIYSLGISTNRDEWLYDIERERLSAKSQHLVKAYDAVERFAKAFPDTLKWSRNLKRSLERGSREKWDKANLVRASYRPFSQRWLFQSPLFVDELGQASRLFPVGKTNQAICFSDPTSQKPFLVSGVDGTVDLHFVGAAAGTIYTPRYRYTKSGERVDNITDWAVAQFVGAYAPSPVIASEARQSSPLASALPGQSGLPRRSAPRNDDQKATHPPAITKDAIFAYCYAVLHDPAYREKYALNLKREFPRIPFYSDFEQWVAWGEALLKLHIGYEDVEPYKLTRVDTPAPKRAEGTYPKPKLKSVAPEMGTPNRDVPGDAPGSIIIDEDTQLTGIPPEAWTYRLGNRSAIDWVLDQHKEKTPRDPTIREKFNTYRFADYKESCIELLAKVVRVSLETVAITEAMKALPL